MMIEHIVFLKPNFFLFALLMLFMGVLIAFVRYG